MTKIQILQYIHNPSNEKYENNEIHYTTFSEPYSFDDFNINIIDLQNHLIWTNTGTDYISITKISDFISLKKIIADNKRSNIVLIFPKNYTFLYWKIGFRYQHSIILKDMLGILNNEIISKIVQNISSYKLHFEKTKTTLNNFDYEADFSFKELIIAKSLTTSTSNKITTIKHNNIFLTTLDITQDTRHLINFLKYIKLINDEEEYPEWLKTYNMFDDKNLKEKLNTLNIDIEKKQKEKEFCLQQIGQNNIYKSILIETGDILVERVFTILEQLLGCDLSNFKDEKKEDFLIQKENIIFIGEIKGVSSNVKNSYISQIRTRYDEFLENNEIDKKNLKPLLVINHQRDIPLSERKKVNIEQIQIAERDNCLIIETTELLKIYELFKNNKISSDDCKKLFFNNKGLLNINI